MQPTFQSRPPSSFIRFFRLARCLKLGDAQVRPLLFRPLFAPATSTLARDAKKRARNRPAPSHFFEKNASIFSAAGWPDQTCLWPAVFTTVRHLSAVIGRPIVLRGFPKRPQFAQLSPFHDLCLLKMLRILSRVGNASCSRWRR